MINSGNIIKNPLTIIAIFAGIVEIGSNTVLPFLTAENQSTYIWFLMVFPFVLVLIFFFILYTRHHVLYAPSDFNDEKNFNELLYNTRKSTKQEVDTKINNEIQILNEESKKLEQSKTEPSTINLNTISEKFMKLIRNDRKILFSLESKLLDNFSLVNNCPVEKNIVLEVTGSKLVADGFVKNENNINIIEVKTLNRGNLVRQIITMFIDRNNSILQKISRENNITLSFVILTPDDKFVNRYKRYEDYFNQTYENYSIKIYPKIINEINEREIQYLDVLSNEKGSFFL